MQEEFFASAMTVIPVRIRLRSIVRDQAGGLTESSRGSQRSGDPRETVKKEMHPRRGASPRGFVQRNSHEWSGIPPGCVPSAS